MNPLIPKTFLSVERFRLSMSEEDEIDIEDVGKGENIGVEVADWLAEKENIPNGIIKGEVERITEKAVLIDDEWVPKSQVEKAWLN